MVFRPPGGGEGPADPGPVSVEIPGKTAMLLVRLAEEMKLRTPGELVSHALGLLETVRQAKAAGQRIVVKTRDGREIDLAL